MTSVWETDTERMSIVQGKGDADPIARIVIGGEPGSRIDPSRQAGACLDAVGIV